MILREYETICVLKPELPEEAVASLTEKLTAIVERFEGTVLDVDSWGKRKLAYPIENHTRGHYIQYLYVGPSDLVAEIERNLNIDDNLLRYLTVKVGEVTDLARRQAEVALIRERRESARLAATSTDDSSSSSTSTATRGTEEEVTS